MQANNPYYKFNFEPDYIDLNEKIQTLTKEAEKNRANLHDQQPQQILEKVQSELDNYDLIFNPSKIYHTSATIQQLNESLKRGANQLCPACGDQIKKQSLCEFCAEIYCKNCCWRKRIIPFDKKENDQKSCCEECHNKYIKLFNNQKFYAQKQLLVKVIDFTKGKYDKARAKKEKLDEDFSQIQSIKRNEKIKESALLKEIKEIERKVKEAEDELNRRKAECFRVLGQDKIQIYSLQIMLFS